MNNRHPRFYKESGLAGTIGPELRCNGMRTTHWPRLFFLIAFSVGLLAACGFNGSVVAADETLDDSETDSETIDDRSAAITIDVDALRASTYSVVARQAILSLLTAGRSRLRSSTKPSGELLPATATAVRTPSTETQFRSIRSLTLK